MDKKAGTLFIVATPIGNSEDITFRALDTLRAVNGVICEEYKPGSTLLKKYNLGEKELIQLNEHNEAEKAGELLPRLLNGESFALISDCGTPVFSDPGAYLIQLAASSGIRVSPMAALSLLDTKITSFYFAGFLPRDPEQRRRELTRCRSLHTPVVVMDTPYRLTALLEDVSKTFGRGQWILIAFDLTLPTEKVYRGEVGDVLKEIGGKKGEFVLVIGR
jgi:16S rRNA (cytidine1402-2'-O)-methyltransferase